MRKTAKQIGIESRPRIDKTKALTLDERIAIVDTANAILGIVKPVAADGPKLAKWLEDNGYEPMMFAHACRIVQSRRDCDRK